MNADLEHFLQLAAHGDGDGIVWLDSSGRSEGEPQPVSRLFHDPVEILTGDFFHPADRDRLRGALTALPKESGALAGSIDYEGRFCFGAYKSHHHSSASNDATDPATADPVTAVMNPEMSRREFCRIVTAAKDYIAAGDIYQVNLAQRFVGSGISAADAVKLYQRLRHISPMPRSAFASLHGRRLLCAAPETFIDIAGSRVVTRPIKGTRPRCIGREQDALSMADLQSSLKERSELIMITDLERNDLGKVCEFGSVQVAELLALESFQHVHHLVSTVTGQLRQGIDAIDVIHQCSPGGSITGAPKKRAMEIIAELEPCPRGAYTGAIGYIGADGAAAFNIAIRTIVATDRQTSFHVGSGIVADSDPEAEYQETLYKGKGMALALGLNWEV